MYQATHFGMHPHNYEYQIFSLCNYTTLYQLVDVVVNGFFRKYSHQAFMIEQICASPKCSGRHVYVNRDQVKYNMSDVYTKFQITTHTLHDSLWHLVVEQADNY